MTFASPAWLWALLGLCLGAMLLLRSRHLALTERAVQWPDAVGLGLFTAGGTQIALEWNAPWLVASLLGVITGVVGGVLLAMSRALAWSSARRSQLWSSA